jgi:uncharacterized membrane protein
MYLFLKLVHVLAVIFFVGNITIGVFWKTIADLTKDPQIIAHTVAGIIRADRIFTIPSIFILLIGGFGAAQISNIPILSTGWILWGLILFIIAGIAFGPISRAQRQLRDVASAGAASGTMDWTRYDQISMQWNVWGTIATVAALIAVALMVLKPALPAFHR